VLSFCRALARVRAASHLARDAVLLGHGAVRPSHLSLAGVVHGAWAPPPPPTAEPPDRDDVPSLQRLHAPGRYPRWRPTRTLSARAERTSHCAKTPGSCWRSSWSVGAWSEPIAHCTACPCQVDGSAGSDRRSETARGPPLCVCVQVNAVPRGCDKIINSGAMEDECGECKGGCPVGSCDAQIPVADEAPPPPLPSGPSVCRVHSSGFHAGISMNGTCTP
jgi:hypothetical protein